MKIRITIRGHGADGHLSAIASCDEYAIEPVSDGDVAEASNAARRALWRQVYGDKYSAAHRVAEAAKCLGSHPLAVQMIPLFDDLNGKIQDLLKALSEGSLHESTSPGPPPGPV